MKYVQKYPVGIEPHSGCSWSVIANYQTIFGASKQQSHLTSPPPLIVSALWLLDPTPNPSSRIKVGGP